MRIGVDVGHLHADLASPCSALNGVSGNVDYRGRLSLCCNLSGFRGGHGDADVAGDLTRETFGAALERLQSLAATQAAKRVHVLKALDAAGQAADLTTGSPCLFCLNTFGKTPWISASPVNG